MVKSRRRPQQSGSKRLLQCTPLMCAFLAPLGGMRFPGKSPCSQTCGYLASSLSCGKLPKWGSVVLLSNAIPLSSSTAHGKLSMPKSEAFWSKEASKLRSGPTQVYGRRGHSLRPMSVLLKAFVTLQTSTRRQVTSMPESQEGNNRKPSTTSSLEWRQSTLKSSRETCISMWHTLSLWQLSIPVPLLCFLLTLSALNPTLISCVDTSTPSQSECTGMDMRLMQGSLRPADKSPSSTSEQKERPPPPPKLFVKKPKPSRPSQHQREKAGVKPQAKRGDVSLPQEAALLIASNVLLPFAFVILLLICNCST